MINIKHTTTLSPEQVAQKVAYSSDVEQAQFFVAMANEIDVPGYNWALQSAAISNRLFKTIDSATMARMINTLETLLENIRGK